MVFYKEGDKSRAVCDTCKKIVSTTFWYAPYNYEELVIPDILQGFCDACGVVVSIPHQSSYKIKEFMDMNKNHLGSSFSDAVGKGVGESQSETKGFGRK